MKLSPEERIERAKTEWDEVVHSVIDPSSFAQIMKKHWIENLGNVSNPVLEEIWFKIASVFGTHIYSHGNIDKSKSVFR